MSAEAEATPDALVARAQELARAYDYGEGHKEVVRTINSLLAALTTERTARQQAEQERDDFKGAWEAAAAQAKDYIERHAHERITRKQAEALLAEADQALATLRAQLDALRGDLETAFMAGYHAKPAESRRGWNSLDAYEREWDFEPTGCASELAGDAYRAYRQRLAALTEQP